jgi:hypothetical protein
MPYAQPSPDALTAAYGEILRVADEQAYGAPDAPTALERIEAILRDGTNRVSAELQSNTTGARGPEQLDRLRTIATLYAAQLVAGLRTAIASGALMAVPMPTPERLPDLVRTHGPGDPTATEVEFLEQHPDQTLVEQFGSSLMHHGAPFLLGGSHSEDELVRAVLGAIGAAASVSAAIAQRPPLLDAD